MVIRTDEGRPANIIGPIIFVAFMACVVVGSVHMSGGMPYQEVDLNSYNELVAMKSDCPRFAARWQKDFTGLVTNDAYGAFKDGCIQEQKRIALENLLDI
jgi:hypothetical protein